MMLKKIAMAFGALSLAGGVFANEAYTVHKVVGTVLSSQDGVVEPVKPGMVLVDGQVLTTSAKSSLVITLKSGCTFTVQPSTTFVVNSSLPCNAAVAQGGSLRLAQLGTPIPLRVAPNMGSLATGSLGIAGIGGLGAIDMKFVSKIGVSGQ